MKNLVIRSIVITLASIVSALSITFGALSVFTPKTIAGFFDDVGNTPASVFFYEMQYDKTGDIKDLANIVDVAYSNGDKELTEKYLSKLFSHPDFEKYGETEISSGLKVKDYYNSLKNLL